VTDPLAALVGRDIRDARDRRVYGVVTALVRRIEDGGRYYLNYLSMGASSQDSAPARVLMPMAGDGRGMHFFPEVGDEVVVAFEAGDTNLPVVIGAVWNRDSPPPSQAAESESNDHRTIVSRSGHELTFDDSAGAEKVLVKSKSGHQLVLDDHPGTGKIEIRTANGASLVLDDAPPGQISLTTAGGCKLNLSDAGGRVSVEAPAILSLKGQIIEIEGTAITLKTTGSVTASAVVVDGKPFGLHQHTLCPVNPSGPVVP
jgi:phage baseplate assembly protein gpV